MTECGRLTALKNRGAEGLVQVSVDGLESSTERVCALIDS